MASSIARSAAAVSAVADRATPSSATASAAASRRAAGSRIDVLEVGDPSASSSALIRSTALCPAMTEVYHVYVVQQASAAARQAKAGGSCWHPGRSLRSSQRPVMTPRPWNRRWPMHGGRATRWVIGTLAAALLIAGPASAGPAAASSAAQTRVPPAAAALPAPVPCSTSAGSCWQPPLVATWQYQLQGSVNSSGQCIYPGTGFINTAVTGTSFATGQQVAPTVFDIDIYQDGKCYTPNNYGVLNSAAVSALHAQGDKVIGYIDAGTAETWRPDYPQYASFNTSC